MRVTYKGDYALKTILSLSLNYRQGPLTIHAIAERFDIPLKFLEQILLALKRGGFVESLRGKSGGYILARRPSEIKLGEVIRFIDGPITPIACIDSHYQGCQDTASCVFKQVWKEVALATAKIVDNLSFADLAKKAKVSTRELIYQI
jgi:Rrf2 family protein